MHQDGQELGKKRQAIIVFGKNSAGVESDSYEALEIVDVGEEEKSDTNPAAAEAAEAAKTNAGGGAEGGGTEGKDF